VADRAGARTYYREVAIRRHDWLYAGAVITIGAVLLIVFAQMR
jgi:energy-coupling factor transporter transmembrane protein EcfT